jgi:hypothetical protein
LLGVYPNGIMHAPSVQVSPHTAPQAPQLLVSVEKSAHPPLQGLKPLSHVNEHVLSAHTATALATPVVQGVAHAPQLLTLVAVFTQRPLQNVGVDAGQVHTPPTHDSPPPQA